MKNCYFVSCFLILCFICSCANMKEAQKIIDNSSLSSNLCQRVLDTDKWKQDTLGNSGYRDSVDIVCLYRQIVDLSISEIETLLGKPDFWCVDGSSLNYQYLTENYLFNEDYDIAIGDNCSNNLLSSSFVLVSIVNNKVEGVVRIDK
jgi:hypothetical protein